MKSFEESLTEYLNAVDSWTTEEESPIVVALQHTAKELDKKITGNLLSQYRQLLAALEKRKPATAEEDGDELDDLIPDS